MEGFGTAAPFARLVAEALGTGRMTLIDIGCSSGIDTAWRVFGERLRALAFDPNLAEIQRLTAEESLPGVEYIAAFVGISPDDPATPRMRAGQFWARSPWDRLSVARTGQLRAAAVATMDAAERTRNNLWAQVDLADPGKPVVLASFLKERGIDDVDFIKIDVDGADFLILRSLAQVLEDAKVLGVGIEVNFFGSDDPDVHTFHNVDRFMKRQGFELFKLSSRPYSMAALPAPYQLTIPAQTTFGRLLQGDALYFRDAAAPENAVWVQKAGVQKLMKLAALFSLANLPDCAAEVLVMYRHLLEGTFDVEGGLDTLVAQALGEGEPRMTYREYIAAFEADAPRFWPALTTP